MSTSVIVGGVGAIVGGVIGGPQGAMWGWSLGSTLGNAIDPPTIRGPSIGDMAQQTTQEGVPIPIVYGMSPPMAGNVMCTSPARIVKKKSGGKGGPKVVTETAFRTYAIQVCEGPIGGFSRVWRNNVKVYDVTDPEFTQQQNRFPDLVGIISPSFNTLPSRNEEFLGKARFFLGAYDQDASEDLEAVFGAGTTPSHRGIAYMVIADEDVTDMRGAIPQWHVQVAQSVPPILTSPTPSGTVSSQTEATIGAETNQPFGTLYIVVGEGSELDGITAEQIIAQVNNEGLEAYDEGTAEISSGTPYRLFITLVTNSTYTYAIVQVNVNGISNVVTGSFSTAAASLPSFIAERYEPIGPSDPFFAYRDPSFGTALGTEVVPMSWGVHDILVIWDRNTGTTPRLQMYITNSFSNPGWWDTVTVNGITFNRTDAALTNGGGADIGIFLWPNGVFAGLEHGETYTVEFE